MAFFPCTYFMAYDALDSRCENVFMHGYTLSRKMEYTIRRSEHRHRNYTRISQLVMIACKIGFRLIIENPANGFLKTYWPLKPALVDMNRQNNGDWFKKPTQYFFVNCEPLDNEITDKLEPVEQKYVHESDRRWERSEIHPQYARRFIKRHILGAQFQDGRQTV